MCVISRTAQASELSQPGEGGDDEDKARFVSPFRVCSDFASKAARRNVEEQEDLAAARRVQNVAINELETAQQAFTVLQNVWLQEFKANGNTEEAKQAEAKKDKAEKKVEKAEQKVKKATQEVEKARKAASASVQAGAVVAVALDLHSRTVVVSVRSTVFCFLGSCSHLGKDPVVVKLSPLRSLGAFRSGGALGCFRFHKKLCCTCFTAWKRHLCGSGKGVMQIFLHLVSLPMLRTGCQS